MCGIAGIVHQGEIRSGSDANVLQSMAHRGPDAGNVWIDGDVRVYHRRLSILDPDPRSNQPFVDVTGRYVLVYNGEIYNYKELKSQLFYPWRSESDTEVLLAWLIKYGRSRLEDLDGMFAFAFFDTQLRTMILARDRFGKKPLYYFKSSTSFGFASELRTLLVMNPELAVTSTQRLSTWLYWQTIPGNDTLLTNIYEVGPGQDILLQSSSIVDEKCYINWQQPNPTNIPLELVVNEIRGKVQNAVLKRLVSDVPFACFLSGGIDSSIIAAIAAQELGSELHTFTVSFEEGRYSEHRIAEQVAKRYHTRHHDIRLTPFDFLNQIEQGLAATDHPSGDGLNTYVVSKQTSAAGFKMALTGIGGDEWFLGYGYFRELDAWHRRSLLRFLKPFKPIMPFRYRKAFDIVDHLHLGASTYPYQRVVWDEYTLTQWLGFPPPEFQPIAPIFPDTMSARSVQEWRYYTQPVLLRDTDQYSMAVGLELRAPWMDHDLVKLALSLPDSWKLGQRPKDLLISAFSSLLPLEVYNRQKQGFTLPWEKWMRNELHEFCSQRILSWSIRMDRPNVFKEWQKFSQHQSSLTWSRWWSLIALEDWLNRNQIQSISP